MEGTEHGSPRRGRRRALIAAAAGVAVLVLYGALGGWLLPRWLRPEVEAQLTAATGLPASIEALRINPFAGTATIESLRLGPADDPMMSLELGDRVDGPDAVKLPVKLGVALLKDRNGIIDLELDVEGRLDDPSFSIGRAVANELW